MSCTGCNPNKDFHLVVEKAKKEAKKNEKQYIIYNDSGEWKYCPREYANGIPYQMVVSQFTT